MKTSLDRDTLVLVSETPAEQFLLGQLSKVVPHNTVSTVNPAPGVPQKEIRLPVDGLLRAAVS